MTLSTLMGLHWPQLSIKVAKSVVIFIEMAHLSRLMGSECFKVKHVDLSICEWLGMTGTVRIGSDGKRKGVYAFSRRKSNKENNALEVLLSLAVTSTGAVST